MVHGNFPAAVMHCVQLCRSRIVESPGGRSARDPVVFCASSTPMHDYIRLELHTRDGGPTYAEGQNLLPVNRRVRSFCRTIPIRPVDGQLLAYRSYYSRLPARGIRPPRVHPLGYRTGRMYAMVGQIVHAQLRVRIPLRGD